MDGYLQKLKEAYQEAKKHQTANSSLQDITINTKTKEITFHWQKDKE
ncbi:MAG: hypothetical protein GX922_09175 [Firmicutes bacterium]|jgi:hypothetical protein|nr:hypothetical protein [Bacillota bacterium]